MRLLGLLGPGLTLVCYAVLWVLFYAAIGYLMLRALEYMIGG